MFRRRAAALLAVAAILVPAAGGAQVIDRWLAGTPLRTSQLPPSERLAAMGGLTIAVEDEDNELTLLDYGRNYAGLLEDRASSSADIWMQRSPWRTDFDDHVELSEARGLLTVRQPGRHAVGVVLGREETSFGAPSFPADDLRWAVAIAQIAGAIDGRPRTDPNPDTVYNKLLDANMNLLPIDSSLAVDGARPSYGAVYNRQIGTRVSFALSETYSNESEKAARTINYLTEFGAKSWDTGAGISVAPISGVVVGGRVNFIDTRVHGLANGLRYRASSAHYDVFQENIPAWDRGAHVFVTVGPMVRGAFAVDKRTAKGNETYELNWGDLIALQRTGGSIQAKGTRFRDKGSVTNVHTRWIAKPLGTRGLLTAAYDRTEGDVQRIAAADPGIADSIVTAIVFGNTHLGSTAWAMTYGGSVRLWDAGTFGLEYASGRVSLTDSLSGAASSANTRAWRTGLEVHVLPWLHTRAGYSRTSLPDTGDHLSRITGGAGYTLADRFAIDALVTFANDARDADAAGPPRASDWTRTLALTTRFAF